jgi:hypothetical protein
MRLGRTSDVSKSGVLDVMWTASCPKPCGMTYRCISSPNVYAWTVRHLDKYHPKAVTQ